MTILGKTVTKTVISPKPNKIFNSTFYDFQHLVLLLSDGRLKAKFLQVAKFAFSGECLLWEVGALGD